MKPQTNITYWIALAAIASSACAAGGDGTPAASSTALTRDGSAACEGLGTAAVRADFEALPTLARNVQRAGCDAAAVCATLLGRIPPEGAPSSMTEALDTLHCLQTVSDEVRLFQPPPPLICNGTASLTCYRPSVGFGTTLLGPGYTPSYLDGSGTAVPLPTGSGGWALPSGTHWSVIQTLTMWPAGQQRVLLGSNDGAGLFLTTSSGSRWIRADGAGSMLEATSHVYSAVLLSATAYGTNDVLVGITGTTNGGVYLSGDGGERWLQINQGFDPNSLSISTLVKTSCAGCPVQYYSGSYGGGLYTRTITVTAPPSITGWCFGSTSCTCGTDPPSGPVAGGVPFRVCGASFQSGATVSFGSEFGRARASGCTVVNSTTLTCTATPPRDHSPSIAPPLPDNGAATPDLDGNIRLEVHNPDARVSRELVAYTYTP